MRLISDLTDRWFCIFSGLPTWLWVAIFTAFFIGNLIGSYLIYDPKKYPWKTAMDNAMEITFGGLLKAGALCLTLLCLPAVVFATILVIVFFLAVQGYSKLLERKR